MKKGILGLVTLSLGSLLAFGCSDTKKMLDNSNELTARSARGEALGLELSELSLLKSGEESREDALESLMATDKLDVKLFEAYSYFMSMPYQVITTGDEARREFHYNIAVSEFFLKTMPLTEQPAESQEPNWNQLALAIGAEAINFNQPGVAAKTGRPVLSFVNLVKKSLELDPKALTRGQPDYLTRLISKQKEVIGFLNLRINGLILLAAHMTEFKMNEGAVAAQAPFSMTANGGALSEAIAKMEKAKEEIMYMKSKGLPVVLHPKAQPLAGIAGMASSPELKPLMAKLTPAQQSAIAAFAELGAVLK